MVYLSKLYIHGDLECFAYDYYFLEISMKCRSYKREFSDTLSNSHGFLVEK